MKVFVPIKKNSSRVPNKNFRDFGGNPLYVHTLLRLKGFDVYVDTDSSEIIDTIRKREDLSHVSVYERNPSLVGDEVSVCSLITDFILRALVNGPVCQVHVTSPFLSASTLKKAHDKLAQYDSIVSCDVIQERLWENNKGVMTPMNHNPDILLPTQDLKKIYRENSLFYIFNAESFLSTGRRVGENPYFFETAFPESLDIDYEEDWNTCVGVYKSGLDSV